MLLSSKRATIQWISTVVFDFDSAIVLHLWKHPFGRKLINDFDARLRNENAINCSGSVWIPSIDTVCCLLLLTMGHLFYVFSVRALCSTCRLDNLARTNIESTSNFHLRWKSEMEVFHLRWKSDMEVSETSIWDGSWDGSPPSEMEVWDGSL